MFSWNRNSSTTEETREDAPHPIPISRVILLNELAETEVGAEAIVSNSGGDETSMIQTTKASSSVIPNMVYCNDEGPSVITHSHMQDSAVTGILQMQRSPNGNIYQDFFVEEQPGTEQLDQCMVNMFSASTDTVTQAAEVATNLNHQFEYESQDVTNENSVELMAQFAADLANVANEQLYAVECREQEERTLLQSTMSPLLAAVNDITKRDMELQLYLNQNQTLNESQAVPETVEQANEVLISANAMNQYGEEEVNNEDHEEECSLVIDNPVECRAKASLPTRYLQFGAIDRITNEPSIYTKKPISHNTKFGPLEGEVLYANDIEMDVLHVQTPRYYPLLLVDESHILDVSNENTSNWMRYVRLAETYAQQNLHLLLQNGKIYFRTLRDINAKEELRIGYHRLYASRFLLPIMPPPTTIDQEFKENKASTWQQEITSKDYAIHPRSLKSSTATSMPANSKRQRQSCLEVLANKQTSSKKRKKKKVKLPSKDLRRFMYKCNLCAKRFYTEEKLELHKTKAHDKTLTKPHMCHVCQQQCATRTALTAHILSHTCSLYTCVYCEQQFKYVRDFKKHVGEHQTLEGTYQCLHCNKHYVAYHLVRKHVRIFHTTRKLSCSQCDKKFPNINNLQRHQLIHTRGKLEKCSQCSRVFSRRDQLKAHVKRVHIEAKNRKWNDSKCKEVVSKSSEELEMQTNVENSVAKIEGSSPLNLDESIVKPTTVPEENVQNNNNKSNKHSVKDDILDSKVPQQKLPTNVSTTTAPLPTSSTSNRRKQNKQTPTKLKSVELNAETVTYVALSDMLTPFLISDSELHDEFRKSHEKLNSLAIHKDKQKESDANAVKPLQEYQANNAKSSNNFICKANDMTNITTTTSNNGIPTINPLYPFKCHLCPNTNFKRRGILVNHFARLHQQVNLNDIDCLNAPLIKPQLIFACPHCSRTYKSKAKRKVHMLKHHPTQELLPSLEAQVVGNIEAQVHRCQHCPRQYAARNRLVNHLRKTHPDEKIPKLVKDYQLPNEYHHYAEKEKVCIESSAQFLEPEINITSYAPPPPPPTCVSPENKLLKLSSAALELSRFDFLNERSGGADDLNRLPALFDETPLTGIDGGSLMERYNHRSIEMQFFEKISKL